MDPFIGEIRAVGFSFAPPGWALCNGQLLPIAQNTLLYSILGTTYGGDGVTTFALPNLAGKVPVHAGQGPGLSRVDLGESGGEEAVTLTLAQIPTHTHGQIGTSPTTNIPSAGTALADDGSYGQPASEASTAHDNMPPFLVVSYIISLTGVMPVAT